MPIQPIALAHLDRRCRRGIRRSEAFRNKASSALLLLAAFVVSSCAATDSRFARGRSPVDSEGRIYEGDAPKTAVVEGVADNLELRMRVGARGASVQVTVRAKAVDVESYEYLQSKLLYVVQQAARWDTPREDIVITIHPRQRDLEMVAGRSGVSWLRAWARYDTLDVTSPREWKLQDWKPQFDKLLIHELTHVFMYQTIAQRDSWKQKNIPMWWTEGLASYSAGQSAQRATWADLDKFYSPDVPQGVADIGDPLLEGEKLIGKHKDIVYGVAHRAVEFLIMRAGEGTIVETHRLVGEGLSFAEAFEKASGLRLERFYALVRDYARGHEWEG
jgi:hypothetical protein